MEIKFVIDPERLTMGDQIALEEGTLTRRQQRDILARHMTNEKGEYLEIDAARAILNDLNMVQLADAADKFITGLNALSAKLVPPVSGGVS